MSAPPGPESALTDASDIALLDDAPTTQLSSAPQQFVATSKARAQPLSGCVLRSRYALEDLIGRGGSSNVYRARDLQLDSVQASAANPIAIKLLRPELRTDPLALWRLQREFEQMQCLSHPGIVQVFELECDGDVWFMSMELVKGRNLKAWAGSAGGLGNALRIIASCCEALEHAHSLNILHGDLKPTNVMVAEDGAVKLIDFGSAPSPGSCIAEVSDSNRAFTPLYASPQILAGKSAERRDDVFSLACLSYRILSGGRHPFGGRPSLEDGRAKSAPTYVRAIPTAIFEVIERGLSAERERRPASVAEFLRALTDAERCHRALASRAAASVSGSARALRRRVSYPKPIRGVQPIVRLTGLVIAIVGAAVLFRSGTHRDVIGAAELPSKAAPETTPAVHDSGVISFEVPTIHASAMQSLVAVAVKRLPITNNRGTFVWRVHGGTARPGVDYERVEPRVVAFSEGQSVRTLFIPLINHASTDSLGPRTFTVALEQVAGGPALGRLARVTVSIDPPPISSRFAVYQARAEQ